MHTKFSTFSTLNMKAVGWPLRLRLQLILKHVSTYKAMWPPHQQKCDKILTDIKTLKSHNVIKIADLPSEILTVDCQYTKQFSHNFIG
jgi:hypothetical protein